MKEKNSKLLDGLFLVVFVIIIGLAGYREGGILWAIFLPVVSIGSAALFMFLLYLIVNPR